MALTTSDKNEIIKKFQTNESDTGSTAVQVALLTERLNYLQGHFSKHQKDHHGRRGLLKIVGQRRKLLDYMKKTDSNAYKTLITNLGLRK